MLIHVLMENSALNDGFAAEHGLSLYLETCGRRILFDAGQSAAFADNALALGVNLSAADFAVLSHGHYDHSDGLPRFLEINDHAPVYIHRRAPLEHISSDGRYIGIAPALIGHPRLKLTDDEYPLSEGLTLCTCNALASGCPASARGMYVREGGALIQDSFDHEQYLIAEENGRRIVISGCSHKGILDIVQWLRPDVLIGGFHFMKLDPQGEDRAFLEDAAHTLLAHDCLYYTGHCTGSEPYAFLKAIMGDRLHAIHAGMTLHI